MQSRPKQTVKASGWYFCIHCYPVLLSEEGWDKDHTWKAVHPENQSASPVRESSPAGCGPCVWQQGQVSHQESLSHHSLTSLFALVLVPGPECTGLPRGTAGHICKSTVVIGNTLLVLEPTVEELKLKQCFLGKEGQRWVLGLCLSV